MFTFPLNNHARKELSIDKKLPTGNVGSWYIWWPGFWKLPTYDKSFNVSEKNFAWNMKFLHTKQIFGALSRAVHKYQQKKVILIGSDDCNITWQKHAFVIITYIRLTFPNATITIIESYSWPQCIFPISEEPSLPSRPQKLTVEIILF